VPYIDRSGCDPSVPTGAYFLTLNGAFGTFDPNTVTFGNLHLLNCPVEDPATTPHTMALTRAGEVYALYTDDFIYHIHRDTYACERTGYKPGTNAYPHRFGMTFRWIPDAGDELRFLSPFPSRLARFDAVNIRYIEDHAVVPDILALSDLQSTPDSRLFAFDKVNLAEIDVDAGQVLDPVVLPNLPQGPWAFLAWRGDFFLFNADPAGNGPTTVRRFHPDDGSLKVVGKYDLAIVGVGASTCAE
jgi:hypothetical protein